MTNAYSRFEQLDPPAAAALARAAAIPLSYGVRCYTSPGPKPRLLVLLGEAHLKLGEAKGVGRAVIDAFELRGVETFQSKRVFAGRALRVLIYAPRILLRAVSFGAVKDSTIIDAREASTGTTVEIERSSKIPLGLHVASAYMTVFFSVAFAAMGLGFLDQLFPIGDFLRSILVWLQIALAILEAHFVAIIPAILLRRFAWNWVVHPAVGILTLRDAIMVEGTLAMLLAFPTPRAAVVVVGRAHLAGMERLLVEEHGFRRVDT